MIRLLTRFFLSSLPHFDIYIILDAIAIRRMSMSQFTEFARDSC